MSELRERCKKVLNVFVDTHGTEVGCCCTLSGLDLGGPDNLNLNAGGGGGLSLPYGRVNTRRYERIDRIAMKLFPIIFILVNVCYWSYYLLLHETFQELWFGSSEFTKTSWIQRVFSL